MQGLSGKTVSLAMCVVLAVGLMPLPAYAESGVAAELASPLVQAQLPGLVTQADSPGAAYTALLAELNGSFAAAQADAAKAQAAVDEATPKYEAAKKAYDEGAGDYEAAKRKADEAKAAYDKAAADKAEADAALAAAQEALASNQAAIPVAQEELTAANAALKASQAEYDLGLASADAAEADLGAAQSAFDAAKAVVDADEAAQEPKENKEAWTALGLFKHIRDNAVANSDEYWDAQCGIEILTGGVNTTNHGYGSYQGPRPDGIQSENWMNISDNVVISDRGDAVALENFKASLDYIDQYNATRARHNRERGTSLPTDIGTNCRQMAISIVQCDASRVYSVGHTQAYFGLENLHWGRGFDPYYGWYDEERALYDEGEWEYSKIGHYLSIIDETPSKVHTVAVGFAVATSGATYGSCSELSMFVNPNSPSTLYPVPKVLYSPAEFKAQWFDAYYQAQVEDGMVGVPEATKAEHRQALSAATTALQEAQGKYDEAARARDAAKGKRDADSAAATAAQNRLDVLVDQTSGLQADVEAKRADADRCATAEQKALADYKTTQQAADELAKVPEYAALIANLANAKEAKDAADASLKAATDKRDTERARLDSAGDLSNAAIGAIEDMPYTGSAVSPDVSVKKTFEGVEYDLAPDSHYRVFFGPNVNVGSVAVTVIGVGAKGEGKTWGSTSSSFNIVASEKSDLDQYKGVAKGSHPDLAEGDWYMTVPDGAFPDTDVLYLDYTLGRGLMSGYTDGSNRFDPWGQMTRGMAITVIYRMAEHVTAEDTDNVHVDVPFVDVRPGDWYAAAVAWGKREGITTGYTDNSGRFGPDDPISREQLATMIARYCESKGMDATSGDVSMFRDGDSVSSWARDGVSFCYAHEIVSGIGDTGNFAPADVALRCQMAKIIAATARMLE